jgi:hypothetical protein
MMCALHTFYVHGYWATHALIHEPVSCANAVGSTEAIQDVLHRIREISLEKPYRKNLIGKTLYEIVTGFYTLH